MKAYVEDSWQQRAVRVWLVEGGLSSRRLLRIDADPSAMGSFSYEEIHEVSAGREDLTPSLILPVEAIEPLVAELTKLKPPNDVMYEALTDARGTRDRLLTLVEHLSSPLRLLDFGSPSVGMKP